MKKLLLLLDKNDKLLDLNKKQNIQSKKVHNIK